jgi:hypothetical protein
MARIIVKAGNKEFCRPLFRQLNILPLHSQYTFSLLLFIVKNLDILTVNSGVLGINTRQASHLTFPANKLTKVQKGVYYSGISTFNNLPKSIRNLSSYVTNFKQALKKFLLLLLGSFYSLNEYYKWNMRDDLGSYKEYVNLTSTALLVEYKNDYP